MKSPFALPEMSLLWRIVFALGIGLLSGALAFLIGLPLPWMLGPMIGTTAAAMLNLAVSGPGRVRPFVIPVIGVMLGSTLTPESFANAGQWVVTLALLPPFLIATAAASYVMYRRIGGFDPVSAYYSAMPGGLNDMLILGAEQGGDERRIALAHAARILVVVAGVVLFYGLVLGVAAPQGQRWFPISALTLSDWLILGACALVGGVVGPRLHLPAAAVFGPMILSGVVHLTGIVTVPPPTAMVIVAQVVIGTVIGCRFAGANPRDVLRDLGLGALSSLIMIAVAVFFALVVHRFGGTALTQAFLAYSPGGLAEMSLLALAMEQDAAYVSLTHVARLFLVIGLASWMLRMIRRLG